MKLKKIITFLSLIFATLFMATSAFADTTSEQVQKIQDRGVLNVGIKQDVPNFGYLDSETGKYSGMEVDLARKIAKELGVKINFIPVTAQTRGALLDNGQVDMVIATFTITEERKKLYNFTTPYYTDASGFLVNKSSGYTSLKDLNGKTIGVAQGSVQRSLLEELAEENKMTFKFVELGSYPELAVSLRAHRIDAFSVDQSILSGYVGSQSEIMDYDYKSADYGVVTKKSNTELNDYLNTLITTWKSDGSLQKLYNKYGLEPSTSSDSNS